MSGCLQIPIFPLPNVVFFPGTLLPLHVFEPRYRAMTADALAGERRIGMVLLKPGWEPHYNDTPDAYMVGSIGRIDKSEPLDDGRYNIVLKGESKFRISRFTQEKPYRIAEVEILRDAAPGESKESLRRHKVSLVEMYKALLKELSHEDVSSLDGLLTLPMVRVVNIVAFDLAISVYDKQSLLELDSVAARYQSLVTIIKDQLRAIEAFRDFRRLAPEDPRVN